VIPPSLEIAFWVALLTFPLIQIVLSVLARADVDILIAYLTTWGPCFNVVSLVPFLFAVIQAIVFLVSTPSGWNTTTAVAIGIVSILAIVALMQLQSFSAKVALTNSIKNASPRPRRKSH